VFRRNRSDTKRRYRRIFQLTKAPLVGIGDIENLSRSQTAVTQLSARQIRRCHILMRQRVVLSTKSRYRLDSKNRSTVSPKIALTCRYIVVSCFKTKPLGSRKEEAGDSTNVRATDFLKKADSCLIKKTYCRGRNQSTRCPKNISLSQT